MNLDGQEVGADDEPVPDRAPESSAQPVEHRVEHVEAAPSREAADEQEPRNAPLAFLRRRWFLGLVGAAFVGSLIYGYLDSATVPTGVGSCWSAEDRNGDVEAVRCDDDAAVDVVTVEVTDPAACPVDGSGYLENGASSYLCLAPAP